YEADFMDCTAGFRPKRLDVAQASAGSTHGAALVGSLTRCPFANSALLDKQGGGIGQRPDGCAHRGGTRLQSTSGREFGNNESDHRAYAPPVSSAERSFGPRA